METNLRLDLQALTCKGNVVLLPKAPLKDYAKLKKALTDATGTYKRNTFEFPYPAQVVINRLLSGENINFKKEFQFFETPEDMAEYMTNKIIGLHGEEIDFLEPECGRGALIKAVLKVRPNLKVTAVELSDINYKITKELYPDINLIHGDFLTHDFGSKKFDLIVANPPFTKNQDIDHVMKMHSLLKKGGQLITVMSTSWTFGNQVKQIEFRRWLEEEVYGHVTENGMGSFKTSGTMVQTVLVEIKK
jgi:SAM-dependent methyltransferase